MNLRKANAMIINGQKGLFCTRVGMQTDNCCVWFYLLCCWYHRSGHNIKALIGGEVRNRMKYNKRHVVRTIQVRFSYSLLICMDQFGPNFFLVTLFDLNWHLSFDFVANLRKKNVWQSIASMCSEKVVLRITYAFLLLWPCFYGICILELFQ